MPRLLSSFLLASLVVMAADFKPVEAGEPIRPKAAAVVEGASFGPEGLLIAFSVTVFVPPDYQIPGPNTTSAFGASALVDPTWTRARMIDEIKREFIRVLGQFSGGAVELTASEILVFGMY